MFKKNTLDNILSDFHKTITKLEALVNLNTDKVYSNRHVIDVMLKENEVLITESTKAEAVKKKLLDLVG